MRLFLRGRVVLAGLFASLSPGCGGGGNVEPLGEARAIAENAGNNGHGATGTSLSPVPSVRVTDASANAVGGTPVVFAVVSGGGSITGPNQTTDASGVATVGSWTLGPAAGTNTLTATAAGLTGSPVIFTAIGEAMVIEAVSPASGPLAGGTSLTISGTSFTNVTGVTVGGVSLGSFTVVSTMEITGLSPASTSSGGKDVVVTSSSHGTSTCSNCFSYVSSSIVTALATGGGHTCALTSSGTAQCWGWNAFGQLGDGSNHDLLVRGAVTGGITFSALTAGGTHTCGLTTTAVAYCWGSNDFGQLGNGLTRSSPVPVPVSGGLTFSLLTAGGSANFPGYDHTCGITTNGAAYCWGYNEVGELGNGSVTNSAVPVPVKGGLRFIALSAGAARSCGITPDGAAYCWGWGDGGQLGNGSSENSSVPVAVSGGLRFSAVSSGFEHACGLTTGGAIYCWGWNDFGQLGDGSLTTSGVPVPVAGGRSFATLGAGEGFSCGLTTAMAAYCWGHNFYGQLGNGSNIFSSSPEAVAGGLTFSAVSTGGWHACAPSSAGDLYCWGNNEVGQLGNGSKTHSNTPVRVAEAQGATRLAAARKSGGVLSSHPRLAPPFRSPKIGAGERLGLLHVR